MTSLSLSAPVAPRAATPLSAGLAGGGDPVSTHGYQVQPAARRRNRLNVGTGNSGKGGVSLLPLVPTSGTDSTDGSEATSLRLPDRHQRVQWYDLHLHGRWRGHERGHPGQAGGITGAITLSTGDATQDLAPFL